jgi:hypothetical protein
MMCRLELKFSRKFEHITLPPPFRSESARIPRSLLGFRVDSYGVSFTIKIRGAFLVQSDPSLTILQLLTRNMVGLGSESFRRKMVGMKFVIVWLSIMSSYLSRLHQPHKTSQPRYLHLFGISTVTSSRSSHTHQTALLQLVTMPRRNRSPAPPSPPKTRSGRKRAISHASDKGSEKSARKRHKDESVSTGGEAVAKSKAKGDRCVIHSLFCTQLYLTYSKTSAARAKEDAEAANYEDTENLTR